MKYILFLIICFIFSCEAKKDVQLPKASISIVKDVQDHSPVYMFFKIEEKDTIAEVNRKNSIISTNWIFNIDKRLPLKLVIPEVLKLQEKKRGDSAHKNEKAQNYYSYADSIGKNLAFLPFTKVYYKMNTPKFGVVVHFTKTNSILVNGISVQKVNLQNYLKELKSDKLNKVIFSFDKNMNFGNYVQNKILLGSLKFPDYNLINEEFIY
jgi:hypothetical protein